MAHSPLARFALCMFVITSMSLWADSTDFDSVAREDGCQKIILMRSCLMCYNKNIVSSLCDILLTHGSYFGFIGIYSLCHRFSLIYAFNVVHPCFIECLFSLRPFYSKDSVGLCFP